MIKVLIVDDSAFMRSAIKRMLLQDPEIEIVGMAKDGEEGLLLAKNLNPDLITLDIEMPVRGGLSMLEELMRTNPLPVLMVSSLTTEGAEATLKALEMGALDFIPKYNDSSFSINNLQEELCAKVRAVSRRGKFLRLPKKPESVTKPISFFKESPSSPTSTSSLFSSTKSSFFTPSSSPSSAPSSSLITRVGRATRDLVGIGVSTGGPPAVQKVLSALPKDFPACIFIAQHMPASFTNAFAKRLDNLCEITVKEAETGDKIMPGIAYVSPGGQHIRIDLRSNLPHLVVTPDPTSAIYKPSANVLFESLGAFGKKAVGIMMTGMGSDGLEGMKVFKQKGGITIAQNEASCVVYGMPKAVVDAGLADEVVDIDAIAASLMSAIYK